MKYLNNNKKASTLPFSLVLIAFVSAISLSGYMMTEEQAYLSVDSNQRDMSFQAAETSIQEVLEEYNLSDQSGLETLNQVDTDPIVRCVRKNSVEILDTSNYENCEEAINYNDDEVIMQSRTKRLNDLCLTWGSSDKNIKCFEIEGRGQIVKTDVITENVQEIQIIEIKQEDNGIYEF